MSRPWRFIQAGDFLLHQPVRGLMDAPAQLAQRLAEKLIDAPFQAAERVFDAAIAEDVEFVLLTGNLCDPHQTGPRGHRFLADQFARLAERGIAIYWAAGQVDRRGEWPANLKWPAGTHVLSCERVERLIHYRDGKPICQIVGRSFDGPISATPSPILSLAPDPSGLFSMAIIPGSLPCRPEELLSIGNQFWACGGSRRPATTRADCEPQCVVHCAGLVQGRTPQDAGAGGCTIVHVDLGETVEPQDRIRLVPIATDVVRWQVERMQLPGSLSQPEYERLLHDRMGGLIAAAPDRTLLIRWCIEGAQAALDHANVSSVAAELLVMLRSEFGYREPPAWSESLTLTPPELPAAWSEQQTLLGEFLRRVRGLQGRDAAIPEQDPPEALPINRQLNFFLTERQLAAGLDELVALDDAKQRDAVLRQASALGAELLSPAGASSR